MRWLTPEFAKINFSYIDWLELQNIHEVDWRATSIYTKLSILFSRILLKSLCVIDGKKRIISLEPGIRLDFEWIADTPNMEEFLSNFSHKVIGKKNQTKWNVIDKLAANWSIGAKHYYTFLCYKNPLLVRLKDNRECRFFRFCWFGGIFIR